LIIETRSVLGIPENTVKRNEIILIKPYHKFPLGDTTSSGFSDLHDSLPPFRTSGV